MNEIKVVIIGGVACGAKAASRIKRLCADADVTIIEMGAHLSYAGCGLPFYLSGEVKTSRELMTTANGLVRDASYFQVHKAVKVLTNTRVDSIDRQRKTVTAVNRIEGASTEISYDTLVLATGSKPIIPDIKGLDLKGVYSFSTLEDANLVKMAMSQSSTGNAVVVGSGLIGIEVADALIKKGFNVTVIEKLDSLLPALFDQEISYLLQKEMVSSGIALMLNSTVTAFQGDESGRIKCVMVGQEKIPADFVVLAVGVRPNTSLAVQAGITLGVTGAISVNRHMQTSDPDIYAGGDCAENLHLITGTAIYAPMGSTANKHGRAIADHICGMKTDFEGVLGTTIFRFMNINMARSGMTEKEARRDGHNFITVLCPSRDRAHFHPDAKSMLIKLVVDRQTRRLLGIQVAGPGDVAKRVDIAVTAMKHQATVDDLSSYDLAYAPPFSAAMDGLITAANIAVNKLDGVAHSVSPDQVWEKMKKDHDFILLDVRSAMEFVSTRLRDARVVNIPMDFLRNRMEMIPKDKEIITLCQVGLRSYEAQRLLALAGFSDVKFMDGGLSCWPYPT